jgi:hypothetical protein
MMIIASDAIYVAGPSFVVCASSAANEFRSLLDAVDIYPVSADAIGDESDEMPVAIIHDCGAVDKVPIAS